MAATPEADDAACDQPASRDPAAGRWVGTCGASFLLGIGLLAWWSYPFQLGDTGGIVSWVTLNDYPIQREPIAFIGALLCVGAGVWGARRGWASAAELLVRRAKLPEARALRVIALGASGLGVSAAAIASGRWSFFSLIALPCLAAALSAWLAWRWRERIPEWRARPPGVQAPRDSRAGGAADHRLVRIAAVIVGALLIYVFLYDAGHIFLLPIDTLHEGERLAHLTITRHGGVPYRDYFVQHGLGQDVGKAWLAATVHDGTLSALRLTECAIRPLGAIALYLLGLALYRSWTTAILLVLLLTAGELTVHDRLAFGLLAVAALARGLGAGERSLEKLGAPSSAPSPSWLLASGVLTAAAFLYSTEVGLYTGAACGATLAGLGLMSSSASPTMRARPLATYALGFAVGMAPLLLYLAVHGALDDFVRNTTLQIGMQRVVWGLPFPPIADALAGTRSPSALVELLLGRAFRFHLPVLILLAWTAAAVDAACNGSLARRPRWPTVGLVLLFGIAVFASALGRSDDRHLMYAIAPSYALLLVTFERWLRQSWRGRGDAGWARRAIPAVLTIGLFGVWWLAVHPPASKHVSRIARLTGGETLPRSQRKVVWPPLGAMGVAPGQLAYLKGVSDYIRTHTEPGQPFYDFTNQAAFHYFADRPSASRYVYVAYAATPDLQREVIAELERSRPELVLYEAGHGASRLDGIPAAKRHPLIDAYIHERYGPAAHQAGAQILRRRDEAVE
jgi:hypothetical protein